MVKIIPWPGVYICDQCIRLCNEIINQEASERVEGDPSVEIEVAAGEAQDAIDQLRRLAAQAQVAAGVPFDSS